MFVDKATVEIYAGDGGNGCVSFLREKCAPRGGPDGGNGGHGGAVVFRAASGEQSLVSLHYRQHWHAKAGRHGSSRRKHGSCGSDCVISVPPGTLIYNAEPRELLADLTEDGEEFVAAKGGRGGKGNVSFANSQNRAPRIAEPGEEGEQLIVFAELKTIADVGLVGFPNAGKSTLLTALTPAHPKTASYPFTTLFPSVGTIKFEDFFQYSIADIPGLIEGAHENVGLGHEFLRHIERCHALVYVLDMGGADGRDPLEDFNSLRQELEIHREGLSTKPAVIAANKIDLDAAQENIDRLSKHADLEIFPMCAELNENTGALVDRLRLLVESHRELNGN